MKIVESVILPTCEYLTFSPYPKATDAINSNMSTSGFVNLMNYGAKEGDYASTNDAALKKALSDIANNQKAGLIIPQDKTFAFSNVLTNYIQHDIVIYAYGATIKKANLSGYGWLQLKGKSGVKAIYAGGTLDGNQQYQQWKGNPTGGRYDGAMLGHNCLLAGVDFDLLFVKDVHFRNVAMDGIRGEDCRLTVVTNCDSLNAAKFHYNTEMGTNGKQDAGVGDQGTIYKLRSTRDNAHFYLLDSTAIGGSIGQQSSFPESAKRNGTVPENIVTLLARCYFEGFEQDLFHIEDSSKVILYEVKTDCRDDGNFFQSRGWIANSTTVFYAQNCDFNNTVINLVNRTNMRFAAINGGSITSSMRYSSTAVKGNLDVIANCLIRGTTVDSYAAFDNALDNAKISGVRNPDDRTILDSEIDLAGIGKLTMSKDIVVDPDPTLPPTAFDLLSSTVLHWTDSEYATSYDVKRNGVVVAADTTDTSINIADFVSTDVFTITAKNESGSIDSNAISIGATGDILPDPVPVVTTMQVGILPYQEADRLNLPIGRSRAVVRDGKSGSGLRQMQRYNGKAKLFPSIVWIGKTFPTDINLYGQKLKEVVDNIPAKKLIGAVLENEPNYGEINGNIATYLQMVDIATKLFDSIGVELFSGGLTFNAIASLCATWYQRDNDDASYHVFKDNHMTAANNDSLDFINEYLQYVQDNNINIHFNFHVHVTAQNLAVLPLVVKKLRQVAGNKKLMCGECSFDRQSADDLKAALTIMKDLDYVLLYDEQSGGNTAVSFNDEMYNVAKTFGYEIGTISNR